MPKAKNSKKNDEKANPEVELKKLLKAAKKNGYVAQKDIDRKSVV